MNTGNYVVRKFKEDDILATITEHYMGSDFKGTARCLILGTPGVDLRFIGVWSQKLNDEGCENTDLNKLDESMDFNGDHSFLEKNPGFCLDLD